MQDQIIRKAFHETILKPAHEESNTIVLDEFGLKNGINRADIAVLNGKLIGYEIKTANDSLDRLASQVDAYNEVFDRVFLVTADNHLEKALKKIPSWWGIYLIKEDFHTEYTFSLYRPSKINRSKKTYGIAQLLWKDELIEILAEMLSLNVNSRTTKHDMYEILSQKCTSNKLGTIALAYLKSRQGWRINQKQS